MIRTTRRSGFTLYHLLVLLAIFAVLLAFLFPAIQKVRERAKVSQSFNNMKQIAIGFHNYASDQRVLPAGNDDNNFSAHTRLLPYIEQANLYQKIDLNKPSDNAANADFRAIRVLTYVSPLDPQMNVVKGSAPTNYLFSAGTQASLMKNDGLFYHNSKLGFVDVTDGTSNTIALIETLKGDGGTKAVDLRRQHVELKAEALKGLKEDAGVDDWKNNKNIVGTRGASWMDGRFLSGTMNAGRRPNSDKPDVSCAGLGGWSGPRMLKYGVHVGLCDGSVRSVSEKVSLKTWRAAITRSGGEVLGNDF